jgi:hypothetical protein
MADDYGLPSRGVVFWPVGTGDSTTVIIDDEVVLQVDLHDMAKADDDENPEVPVVDRLVDALPLVDGEPYLAVFALTHADKDQCLGFADLLEKVRIGQLWSTPRAVAGVQRSRRRGSVPGRDCVPGGIRAAHRGDQEGLGRRVDARQW